MPSDLCTCGAHLLGSAQREAEHGAVEASAHVVSPHAVGNELIWELVSHGGLGEVDPLAGVRGGDAGQMKAVRVEVHQMLPAHEAARADAASVPYGMGFSYPVCIVITEHAVCRGRVGRVYA